jgi:hypothetical protein
MTILSVLPFTTSTASVGLFHVKHALFWNFDNVRDGAFKPLESDGGVNPRALCRSHVIPHLSNRHAQRLVIAVLPSQPAPSKYAMARIESIGKMT